MVRPTSARLGRAEPAGLDLLILGNGLLLGASQRGLSDVGLPRTVVEQLHEQHGSSGSVDVLWDLTSSMHAIARLSNTDRLRPYDAVVIVTAARFVPAMARRLRQILNSTWSSKSGKPHVVMVLASNASDASAAAHGEAQIEDIAASLPHGATPRVLHAGIGDGGEIRDPRVVAAAIVRALVPTPPASPRPADDPMAREVAVDRSLRALRGRTGHLRRSLVLAQTTFGVPYAQLNLVSRGTLRSLAFIGRSSDGLERSLSAEAVRRTEPLLVADTQAYGRFSDIPETRGPEAIRYYVGHPVRANSGHAVGVLCVLDTAPHDIAEGDATLIRDLALLAEGELAAISDDA